MEVENRIISSNGSEKLFFSSSKIMSMYEECVAIIEMSPKIYISIVVDNRTEHF